jgi:excisionase family DNA binding protein
MPNAAVMLTVQEAAKRCRVTPQTIRRWCHEDRIPYVRHGHKLVIYASGVDGIPVVNEDVYVFPREGGGRDYNK